LVELEVDGAEVGPVDVPVGLLGLQGQVDEVDEGLLKAGEDLLRGLGSHLLSPFRGARPVPAMTMTNAVEHMAGPGRPPPAAAAVRWPTCRDGYSLRSRADHSGRRRRRISAAHLPAGRFSHARSDHPHREDHMSTE